MSSSSETAAQPARAPRYCAHPRLIRRNLHDGLLIRRWDLDDDPLVLNASARLLLDVIGRHGSPTLAEVTVELTIATGLPAAELGDLTTTVEHLVASGLLLASGTCSHP